MKIEKNKVVSLSYTLTVDGDVIETVNADKPMQFIFGSGYLLPKFEQNVAGKEVGDTFDFNLSPEEGYGEVDSSAIVELPKEIFMVDGKIEDGLLNIGNVLPMQDSDGNKLQGSVEEVKESVVVMNFNHPLAGATLNFKGKVETLRDAEAHEILEGLYGEKKKHSSCDSGGCSGCGGGC